MHGANFGLGFKNCPRIQYTVHERIPFEIFQLLESFESVKLNDLFTKYAA